MKLAEKQLHTPPLQLDLGDRLKKLQDSLNALGGMLQHLKLSGRPFNRHSDTPNCFGCKSRKTGTLCFLGCLAEVDLEHVRVVSAV